MLDILKFLLVILSILYTARKLITPLNENIARIETSFNIKMDKLTDALNALTKSVVTGKQCEKYRKELEESVDQKIAMHNLEGHKR